MVCEMEEKEKYLKIINNYGVISQLKYFQSEVFELNEAIITQELDETGYNYEIKHIAEEIADCLVMIRQFKEYYDISNDEIKNVMKYKVKRQLERIKNEKGEKI